MLISTYRNAMSQRVLRRACHLILVIKPQRAWIVTRIHLPPSQPSLHLCPLIPTSPVCLSKHRCLVRGYWHLMRKWSARRLLKHMPSACTVSTSSPTPFPSPNTLTLHAIFHTTSNTRHSFQRKSHDHTQTSNPGCGYDLFRALS